MHDPRDPGRSASNRRAIGAGVVLLSCVLILAALIGPPQPAGAARGDGQPDAVARPVPQQGHGPVGVEPQPAPGSRPPATAAVPAAPRPDPDIPALALEAADRGEEATFDAVLAEPTDAIGRLFTCVNASDALPVPWRTDAVPSGDGPAAKLAESLRRAEGKLAPHRLTLDCREADLRARSVLVYFHRDTVGAIGRIGRDTKVTLQVLGTGPTGQLAARFVRVVAFARPRPPLDASRPDWLQVLLQPELHVGHVLPCLCASAPRLVASPQSGPSALPRLVAALQTGPSALVSCEAGSGVEVPLLVSVPRDRASELLRMGPGVRVTVRVTGSDSRVLGDFVGIEGVGVATGTDDLRLLLLGPAGGAVGQRVQCVSMGLPLPNVVSDGDPDAQWLNLAEHAPRKAWLACAQAPRPPVHLTLYLARGHEAQLLDVVRGTRIEVDVLGVDGDRILGRLGRILGGAASEPSNDLRRWVLLSDGLRGQPVRCVLGREVEPAPAAVVPERVRGWVAPPAQGPAHLATCVDAVRPVEGQRFVVLGTIGPPAPVLNLRFLGVANNLPVATALR